MTCTSPSLRCWPSLIVEMALTSCPTARDRTQHQQAHIQAPHSALSSLDQTGGFLFYGGLFWWGGGG